MQAEGVERRRFKGKRGEPIYCRRKYFDRVISEEVSWSTASLKTFWSGGGEITVQTTSLAPQREIGVKYTGYM